MALSVLAHPCPLPGTGISNARGGYPGGGGGMGRLGSDRAMKTNFSADDTLWFVYSKGKAMAERELVVFY